MLVLFVLMVEVVVASVHLRSSALKGTRLHRGVCFHLVYYSFKDDCVYSLYLCIQEGCITRELTSSVCNDLQVILLPAFL